MYLNSHPVEKEKQDIISESCFIKDCCWEGFPTKEPCLRLPKKAFLFFIPSGTWQSPPNQMRLCSSQALLSPSCLVCKCPEGNTIDTPSSFPPQAVHRHHLGNQRGDQEPLWTPGSRLCSTSSWQHAGGAWAPPGERQADTHAVRQVV